MAKPDNSFGFVRVAAAVPVVHVADPLRNVAEMLKLVKKADEKHVQLLVFPELCITGYTCKDAFFQETLLRQAREEFEYFLSVTSDFAMVIAVGMPLKVDDSLFNVTIMVCQGKILGIIPKLYPPTDGEFEERRWFSPGIFLNRREIELCGQSVPIGTDILIEDETIPNFRVSAHICQDGWQRTERVPHEALIVFNPSASTSIIAKEEFRKTLVEAKSAYGPRCYIYVSCGYGESSDEVVFDGDAKIAENGSVIVQSERFRRASQLIVTDIDVGHLSRERMTSDSYGQEVGTEHIAHRTSFCKVRSLDLLKDGFCRKVDPHPFVPSDPTTRDKRCMEAFSNQTLSLAHRLEELSAALDQSIDVSIGISGGLDSTLALLTVVQVFDMLGWDKSGIHAYTLPGYGTTSRTKKNAHKLCEALGVPIKEVSIVELTNLLLRLENHEPCKNCLKCQNAQARVRTLFLMTDGFVVGTGDLSEAMLGWCTYNGDHASMYNPNAGVAKTMVQHEVRWIALGKKVGAERAEEASKVLIDILLEPIAHELTEKAATTENEIGPYELNDFFIYQFQRRGVEPRKIFFLAIRAPFDGPEGKGYSFEEILGWLRKFYPRRFAAQFKMNASPNGPLVGTVGASPRGKNRWPSDIDGRIWKSEADAINPKEFRLQMK